MNILSWSNEIHGTILELFCKRLFYIQILMIVLRIHVRMMELALMELINTTVVVLLVTLDLIAKQVITFLILLLF